MVPIDLIIDFHVPESKTKTSKEETRKIALEAEKQYAALLETLSKAGLRAVGKGGERSGKIMICVECPPSILAQLIRKERHSDFIHGLPTVTPPALSNSVGTAEVDALTPSARTRLLYTYITSTAADGGLGISHESPQWSMVDSITTLHDRKFNDAWVRSWSTHIVGGMPLDTIRNQFGDGVALYFSFLTTYTIALIFPSVVGFAFWYLWDPFSPIYSIILLLWATTFVEFWRINEHILSLRWGTAGAKAVEMKRHVYKPNEPWWLTELRYSASTPIILLFAIIVTLVISSIFLIEAFATHLYEGPGHQYMSLAPTILFTALIPTVLSTYQKYAIRFTKWENHAHQSSYDASLTRKTFALSAIVAYLGLTLSAFVYMPFGSEVMAFVQSLVTKTASASASAAKSTGTSTNSSQIWITDAHSKATNLDPTRLQNQMYAYTVTNQGINTFLEIGLPYIMRFAHRVVAQVKGEAAAKKHSRTSSNDGKKRVDFQGEGTGNGGSKEEREFLGKIRSEVAKPEFLLFTEYSEMVTQFGYVTLWSSIWPLAPFCALVNNIIELRSDAIKLTQHVRHPIPERVDTIGPWLDCLTFLTWLGALSNAALVYLFRPAAAAVGGTILDAEGMSREELLSHAVLISLCASHGYILLRASIRHVLKRVLGSGGEIDKVRNAERQVKESYLKSLDGSKAAVGVKSSGGDDYPENEKAFWATDFGLDEVRRAVKDA